MKTLSVLRRLGYLSSLLLAGLAVGCDPEPTAAPRPAPAPAPKAEKQQVKKVELAKNIFLELQGERRRVILSTTVCLQKGALELFLTRKDTKEHEAIVTIEADARDIHKALVLARAEPGAPVKYDPAFQPARGQTIKITVQYRDKDKVITVPAQEWIRNTNTKKILDKDWVFAGSRFVPNPLDANKLMYLANDGDVVCISNFDTAMLDLPIKVSKDNAALAWEVNSEKVPPVGTPVTVILEPVPNKK
jgi:hypothetical protein